MTIGVTAGKFYPLHRGHIHMLERACDAVDQLYILLVFAPGEDPPPIERLWWIKEAIPDAIVVPTPDPGHEQDSVFWAKFTYEILHEYGVMKIDKCFGSEAYTETWAGEMGAGSYVIDAPRKVVPISGTECRADPIANFDYLSPGAKQWYARRVCIVGGESCGKSTLVRKLAEHYNTVYTEEVGRWFTEEYPDHSDEADNALWKAIIATQTRMEDMQARQSNGLVLCDTDLLTTSVWHQKWVGIKDSTWLDIRRKYRRSTERWGHKQYDLYILLEPTVPWVDDGTRSEQQARMWFHDKINEAIQESGCTYSVIDSPDYKVRFNSAVELIDRMLAK